MDDLNMGVAGTSGVFEAGPLPEPDLYVGEDQW